MLWLLLVSGCVHYYPHLHNRTFRRGTIVGIESSYRCNDIFKSQKNFEDMIADKEAEISNLKLEDLVDWLEGPYGQKAVEFHQEHIAGPSCRWEAMDCQKHSECYYDFMKLLKAD